MALDMVEGVGLLRRSIYRSYAVRI